MDLYRLSGTSPKEFDPLSLPNVYERDISLIEWPNRLAAFPELLPPPRNRLNIDLRIRPRSEERTMTLSTANAESSWTDRLQYLVDEEMVDDLILLEDDEEERDGDSVGQGRATA